MSDRNEPPPDSPHVSLFNADGSARTHDEILNAVAAGDVVEPPFISDPMFTCADCGRSLTLRRGKWAHIEPNDDGWGTRYVFTCRSHTRTEADDRVVLEAADYHYVAGESQRHFDRSSL